MDVMDVGGGMCERGCYMNRGGVWMYILCHGCENGVLVGGCECGGGDRR